MGVLNDLQQTAANVGRSLADATNVAIDAFSGLWPGAATTISAKAGKTKDVVQDTASKAISTVGETTRGVVQQGAAFVGQKATGLSEKLAENPSQRTSSTGASTTSGTTASTHPKTRRKGAPLSRKPTKAAGKPKRHATRSVKQPAASAKSPVRNDAK